MIAQEFIEQLLAHMGIEDATVDTTEADDALEIVIHVSEQDSGLLIGRHAETIDALQRVVRLVFQKDGDKRINININDFRQRREERLQEIAQAVAERVIETKEPQMLRLPAHERRLIHMHLADHPEVETVSEGEGNTRVLYVRLKAA